jgi:transposase
MQYFFLKGHESKLIQKKLVSTLQDNAISYSTVKNWLRRFKSGELSWRDEERPRRPLISLAPVLQRFLKKLPFANARVMARHLPVDRVAIKSRAFLIGN